jgi:hypothetical protein
MTNGQQKLAEGKLLEAINLFQNAVAADLQSYNVHVLLAGCYRKNA